MAEEETYEFDPWEASSGLPDFMQVRIENPHFATDAQVQNGQLCLFKPEGTVLSGDGIDEPTQMDQYFSCGPGWEPAGKGGTRVVREDGKQRMFNNNTAYAHLFLSLRRCAKEQGMEDQLRKRGTPFDAATWAGLVLDLKREPIPDFTTGDGTLVTGKTRLVVSGIVKMGDTVGSASGETVDQTASVSSAPASAPAPETPAEASAPVSTPVVTDNGAVELDPKIRAKLSVLARQCDERRQFIERGFMVEGVLDNPVAEDALQDEGPGSIWATVKAEA